MAEEQEAGTTTVVSVRQTYLYEEVYQPCFLWTLILAPCFMPAVWYVLFFNVPRNRHLYIQSISSHHHLCLSSSSCRKYHVRVTTDQLQFGYSSDCMAMYVDRTQILTIEKVSLISPLMDWGGWGIRKQLPSWDTGYITRKGPGMRITITDNKGKERCYTFCCNDPDAVIDILAGSS
jgi:hypothetical protein